MVFGDALERMKAGQKMTRENWIFRDVVYATRKELGDDTTDSPDEQNELNTGYMRSKETILRQFVAALMAEDTDLQSSLKEELKELDADYDEQNKKG